jgi:hypothetical protein
VPWTRWDWPTTRPTSTRTTPPPAAPRSARQPRISRTIAFVSSRPRGPAIALATRRSRRSTRGARSHPARERSPAVPRSASQQFPNHEASAVSRLADDGSNSSAFGRRAPRAAVEASQPRGRYCGSNDFTSASEIWMSAFPERDHVVRKATAPASVPDADVSFTLIPSARSETTRGQKQSTASAAQRWSLIASAGRRRRERCPGPSQRASDAGDCSAWFRSWGHDRVLTGGCYQGPALVHVGT